MSALHTLYPPMRGLANLPWFFGLQQVALIGTPNSAVNVTASSTIHTKGAWAQLIASTSAEIGLLSLQVSGLAQTNVETSCLIDLATGASGSEVVFAENIAVGGARVLGDSSSNIVAIPLPVRIPSGTRIAARCQALIASDVVGIASAGFGFPGMHMLPTTLDTYGTSTATSRGTTLTGASGSWTEIAASTTQRYRAIVIVPSIPTSSVAGNRASVRLTAGFGTAGAEVEVGSILCAFDTLERLHMLPAAIPLPLFADVPAGSRLAVKHDLASSPGDCAVTLIGVP